MFINLINLWPGDWKNKLERMNIKVDEDNGKSVGMVNVRARKFWRFSSNEFWKNIDCLVSAPTFGLGGSRMWEKYEAQKIIVNKSKSHTIRVKVDLYDFLLSYIIYCLLFYIMTILTPFFYQIFGISHTRGKEFRKYWPQGFKSEEDKDSDEWRGARLLIYGFNEACKNVADSYMKVEDESMSAIRFRTSVKGDLPESHNKSRQYDLALEIFWVTHCGWLRLCTTVSMGMTIINFWKIFCYGVKRDHYDKLIDIREFLGRLALDCFNNPFSTDTGTLENNIPLLDEVDDGETVSTCRALHFSSSGSCSTEVSTISNMTLNSASSSAYTLVASTIGSQHTAEKEGAREGGRYNRAVRGYCNGRLPNGKSCLKRTLRFYNGCTRFNKKTYHCKQVGCGCFASILTPSSITVDMFALAVP